MQLRKVVENFNVHRKENEPWDAERSSSVRPKLQVGVLSLSAASWHQTAAKRICIH